MTQTFPPDDPGPMNRTAFLTGATGFIGGKLAQRLSAEGWAVHALVRGAESAFVDGVSVHRYSGGTAEVITAIEQVRPDVVFHLASLYLVDHRGDQVEDLVAANVLLTAQLAEALTVGRNGRLINTGTAWQHYEGADYDPVNLYAATKQAGIDLLRYYHEARGLSVLTLELFDTYGVGDKRRKLVQLLVDAAASGEPLSMSPGEQTVDMTHVDDVVDAFVAAAGRIVDAPVPLWESAFVSGERMTVRMLASRVARAVGRPIAAEFGGRPYRSREVMMPIDPTGQVMPGWSPRRMVEDYIEEVLVGRMRRPTVDSG